MRTNFPSNAELPTTVDVLNAIAVLQNAISGVLARAAGCSRTDGVEVTVSLDRAAFHLMVGNQRLYRFGQYQDALAFFDEEAGRSLAA